jgi:hypothetical protein
LQLAFDPTRSFCYQFARYTVLPEVTKIMEASGGETHRLSTLAQEVIDVHLTAEQQQLRIKKAQSERTDPVHSIIKFFVAFIAKEQQLFVKVAAGQYRAKIASDISDSELEEIELEECEENDEEYDGWIYAFSFPALVRTDTPYPIKIGKTIGAVEDRVAQQCKGSATFDNPVILGRWQVQRVGPFELAIHNTLKTWGKWRENVPGVEWFDTTVPEIEAIIGFLKTRN